MRLLNRLWLNYASGGYIYQAETVTLLRALTGTYSTARKIQIDKMIKSLKAAGIWAKLDVFQMYAAPTAADAVVNWKSPGTFNATLVNSPTLEADRGITGDTAKGVNTNFNPGDGGTHNYLLDSCSVGIAYAGTPGGTVLFGVSDGTNTTSFNITKQLRLNSVVGSPATFIDAKYATAGIIQFCRTSSTSINGYVNGGTKETKALNSLALPNYNIYVNAYNSSGTLGFAATGIITRLFYAGSSMSDAEVLAFSTALETYLDYIGAGVIA